jgi:hypothetical protein
MKKRDVPPRVHLFAGAISGFASCIIVQPLDVVRLQRLSKMIIIRDPILLTLSIL